ncbi:hypothetical protein DFQ28_006228 [Apophysomyces sp. BC1034]|nr:hypothetical protein DFQ28_006228 [Apophysomyces sp. BC1034]
MERPLSPGISECSFCSCASADGRQSSTSTSCTTPVDLINRPQEDLQTLTTEPVNEHKQRKQSLRRFHAINELFQTERDYVCDLMHLVEVCFQALSQQDWISQNHKYTIIRNASDILALHKRFLNALERSDQGTSQCQHIANVFVKMGPEFMLYTHYCDLHSEAWSLCSDYRTRPDWTFFLKDCAMMDSTNEISCLVEPAVAAKRLHFEDYMIKLLIKEIIRYTAPDADEQTPLNKALEIMQQVVTEIDCRKHQRDTTERTERFTQRLDGDWRISKTHVSKLGNLVIAGALEVTYTALGQSVAKPRYLGCFVFPTYIILVRAKKATNYEPKHWFPLELADFEDLLDIEDMDLPGQRENAFVVRCKKHTFAFNATCSQEKQIWVQKLKQTIDSAKSKKHGFSGASNAENFIVSSLPGVATKIHHHHQQPYIRLSRSFTNLLDMTISGASPSSVISSPSKAALRRSMSIDNLTKDKGSMPSPSSPIPPAAAKPAVLPAPVKKHYSVDYVKSNKKDGLRKSRNNSETYLKPSADSIGQTRRRPNSLDLLSTATATGSSGNMIGKMSFQFKSNHYHALRMAADHKLHDVCTQDYLSSRAWYMRDKDNSITSPQVDLRKRKSAPFMRSSASSFSVISLRRTSDAGQMRHARPEYDVQSTVSSASSMDDPHPFRLRGTSRTPSQISQLRSSSYKNSNSNNNRRPSDSYMRSFSVTEPSVSEDFSDTRRSSTSVTRPSFSDTQDSHRRRAGPLPSPTSVFSSLDRSLSSYSISVGPLKSSIKSAFVDKMLQKLSPRSHPSNSPDSRGRNSIGSRPETSTDKASTSDHPPSCADRYVQHPPPPPPLDLSELQKSKSSPRFGLHTRPKSPLFRWIRGDTAAKTQTLEEAVYKYVEGTDRAAFAYASTTPAQSKLGWKEKINAIRQSNSKDKNR